MWVNDRFDEGRRVVEDGLKDGRKLLDRSLDDGRGVLERGWREGREALDHRLHDGRRVLELRLRDGRKVFDRTIDDGRGELDQRTRQGRKLFDRTLDDGRDALDARVRQGRKVFDRSLNDGRKALNSRFDEGRRLVVDRFEESQKAASPNAPLWPILLVAAGAGGAFWWWTQWSRGKAEAEARAAVDKREGGGEVPIAHPEMVMAHHEVPAGGPSNAIDKADDKVVEPAEQLMMHAPVDDTPVAPAVKRAGAAKGVKTVSAKAEALASVANQALAGAPKAIEESLGVQGSATAPKPERKSAPNASTSGSAAPSSPRKGGPTIM